MPRRVIKPKPCPCGRVPENLFISRYDYVGKFAHVCGDCCGEWIIEFGADYLPVDSPECIALAIKAWNDAGRETGPLRVDID